MAKSVSLDAGRSFATISSARQHFAQMLDSNDIKQAFSGDDLVDVEALYLRYCAKTNWPLPSPPISFFPIYDRGPGYTTRCFGVAFANGTTDRFSLDKALRAIAV